MFINDLPDCLHSNGFLPLSLHGQDVRCLLYADDLALFGTSIAHVQQQLDNLVAYAGLNGLTIHPTKTEYMRVLRPLVKDEPDPRGPYEPEQRPERDIQAQYALSELTLNGSPLQQVDRFKYVGAILANDGTCEYHVQYALYEARIAKQSRLGARSYTGYATPPR